MVSAVLDSSAVLAFFFEEPGGDRVVEVLSSAAISAVNHAEVLSKLIDRGAPRQLGLDKLGELPLSVVSFDAEAAIATGSLRESTREFGLSLADRACLALAARLAVPAYTADRAWDGLGIGVDIELIR